MNKKILMLAFEKAKEETGNSTPNGQAKHLAITLTDDFKTSITQRSMMRYYDGKFTPRVELLNALAKYLGYTNYDDFVKKEGEATPPKFPWVKVVIGGVVLCIGIIGFNIDWSLKKCMIWQEDHYEKTSCPNAFSPDVKLLDVNLIENFKKVTLNPNTMVLFDEGKPLYWYAKHQGNVEFFTMQGFHPETQKRLHPITQAIIRKYVYQEK